jgi:hypothetical protein
MELPDEAFVSGRITCPECGMVLQLPEETLSSRAGQEETQLVSIQEMARMAQDGVDMEVSGEWDTADPENRKTKPD